MSIAREPYTGGSQDSRPTSPPTFPAGGKMSRQRFIIEQLRLSHDPFLYEAAETEVQEYPDDFFAYFVIPDPKIWQRLLSAQHLVVFGAHGSGKTTLRLNLARQLRYLQPPVLAVTCDFGDSAAQDMCSFVAQQMAKDLLIQTLELLDTVVVDEARDAGAIEQLCGLVYGGLHDAVQRAVQSRDGERIDRRLAGRGRESSEYMQLSPALRRFLRKLLDATPAGQGPPSVAACLNAAQRLGFAALYVLADGFDARNRTPEQMASLLQPLVATAGESAGQLVLKAFLPTSAKTAVAPLIAELAATAGEKNVAADLHWHKETLDLLLEQRFRAARRHDLRTFSDLAHQVAGPVATPNSAAYKLPRTMLEAASALLDAPAVAQQEEGQTQRHANSSDR